MKIWNIYSQNVTEPIQMFVQQSQRVNVKQLSFDQIYVHQRPVILFFVEHSKQHRELA